MLSLALSLLAPASFGSKVTIFQTKMRMDAFCSSFSLSVSDYEMLGQESPQAELFFLWHAKLFCAVERASVNVANNQ